MGLFDFLKGKRNKGKKDAGNEAAVLMELGDPDQLEIDPPETRYTQEYIDFLAAQEAAERETDPDEPGDD